MAVKMDANDTSCMAGLCAHLQVIIVSHVHDGEASPSSMLTSHTVAHFEAFN